MNHKKTLLVAFVTIFLDLIGFGIIIPVQPFFAQMLGASPASVTLLGASYSLMQFLFAPFWGRLSDKYGRRPIILIGVSSSVVGYLIFGLAESLVILFAARMLSGFGNANIAAAQAIIADITTKENRAKGMGIIGAAFGLGFIFGPAIGGIAGQSGPQYPAFIAAGLGALNLVLAWFLLPETRKETTTTHARRGLFSLKAVFEHGPKLGALFAVTLITILAFAIMEQIVGLYIEKAWVDPSLSSEEGIRRATELTAYFLVAVGVMATLVQGGLIGRLSKRFSNYKIVVFSLLTIIVGLVLAPTMLNAQSMTLLLLSGVLFALGMGLFSPSSIAFVSNNTNEENQGELLGLNQSMAALGRVLGPAVAGSLFVADASLPFYVAAILTAVAAVIAIRYLKKPTNMRGQDRF